MGKHSQPDETPGTHRAVGARRGVATWPLAVLAALAVLTAGIVAVAWGVNSADAAANAESRDCSEGTTTLHVAAAPELNDRVAKAADQWNRQHRVVFSHCVTVASSPATAKQATAQIVGDHAPSAWLSPTDRDAADLQKHHAALVATTTDPLSVGGKRYPYVVIAGKGVDDMQQRAAQAFRDYLDEPDSQGILAG